MAIDIDYFALADDYSDGPGCVIKDAPTIYTAVVRNGVRKPIRTYAPEYTAA